MQATFALPTAPNVSVTLDSAGVPSAVSIEKSLTQIQATINKEPTSALQMSLVSNTIVQEITITLDTE